MTNLREYKDQFVEDLSSLYSRAEAESLFFIFLHEWAGMSKLEYLSNAREKIYDKTHSRMEDVRAQLLGGKPFQYLLGYVSFALLYLEVSPEALIPRPETEELAFLVKREMDEHKPDAILDVGTGTGCLALAMKSFYPAAEVLAVDISSGALELAQKNAAHNRLDLTFRKLNFLEATERPAQNFDMIVSNPPYIADAEKDRMDRLVLEHDPHQALFVPDEDPLVFYRAIAEFAQQRLNSGGNIYTEINERLGPQTLDLFEGFGFKAELRKDIYQKHRFVVARREK